MLVAGMVESKRSGQMIVAGSRCELSRMMQLDDRCGKLRSVKLLNAAGRSLQVAEVGRG